MDQEEGIDYFTSLNEDCILEIFERLTLDELCAINDTCKKLRQLAQYHFPRKYPNLLTRRIYIEKDLRKGQIGFYHDESYVRCFSKHIQSIEICERVKMDDKLLGFIRTNCCPNIKNIAFNNYRDGTWSETFVNGIKDILFKAEAIDLCGTPEHLSDIPKYLPAVKKLRIQFMLQYEDNFEGLKLLRTMKCPRLEEFIYSTNQSMLGDLKSFLEQHETIKRFICITSDLETECFKQLLKIVAATNISELFVANFDGCHIDFALIRSEFEMLDNCAHFKRLEVCLDDGIPTGRSINNIFGLASSRSFSGLYLSEWDCPMVQFNPASNLLTNLTTLTISYYISELDALNLAQKLPNLNRFTCFDEKAILTPFVRYTPKLTKIIVMYYDFEHKSDDELPDLQMLNDERNKLNGATKLIIYLTDEIEDRYKNKDPLDFLKDRKESQELVTMEKVNIPYFYEGRWTFFPMEAF